MTEYENNKLINLIKGMSEEEIDVLKDALENREMNIKYTFVENGNGRFVHINEYSKHIADELQKKASKYYSTLNDATRNSSRIAGIIEGLEMAVRVVKSIEERGTKGK